MALGSRFFKRTALATLLTLALVGMMVAVYKSPIWAVYYVFAGIWSLVFLGLTPLIMKTFMYDRRPLVGLALIAAKLVWLGVGAMVCLYGSSRLGNVLFGSALIAGISTPLVVLTLRALGSRKGGTEQVGASRRGETENEKRTRAQ